MSEWKHSRARFQLSRTDEGGAGQSAPPVKKRKLNQQQQKLEIVGKLVDKIVSSIQQHWMYCIMSSAAEEGAGMMQYIQLLLKKGLDTRDYRSCWIYWRHHNYKHQQPFLPGHTNSINSWSVLVPSTVTAVSCFHFLYGEHVFILNWKYVYVYYYRLVNFRFTGHHHLGFEAAAWNWHFVDVVLVIFVIGV